MRRQHDGRPDPDRPRPVDRRAGTAPHRGQAALRRGRVPEPEGDAAIGVERHPLPRHGRLWSWTSQGFRPKSPYEGPGEGPQDFTPYLLGYVEIPGEVIVESYIVDARLEDLKIDMPVEFCVVPFNDRHTTYAFRPEQQA